MSGLEVRYAVDCGYLVEVVNEHTCGAGDWGQHEPGCGTVPVAPIEELLRALAERDALAARVEAVERLRDRWKRLADEVIDPENRAWLNAAYRSLTAALASPDPREHGTGGGS